VYLERFVRRAAQSLPPGSLVLDAGAGPCPYRPLFSHVNYESADFCQIEDLNYGQITYVCDLTSIPVEDERYDLVLCTQVITELPEPQAAIQELYRILKPGKELWISAALFYAQLPIPYDFYRFAESGFCHLLEKAGFQVKEVDWLEGYYGTLSYKLKEAAKALPSSPRMYGGGLIGAIAALLALVLKPAFALLSFLYGRLDLRFKNTQSGFPKNYAVIAAKPTVTD
jgi:SAM-dependent methyltransferase